MLRLTAASSLMASVAASGPGNAWAAGAAPGRGRAFDPIIEHWDGSAWRPVLLPAAIARKWRRAYPFSVSTASSASDFWAVSEVLGEYLHWNGRSWHTGQLPGGSAGSPLVVSSLLQFGRADVWAFGGHLVRPQTGAAEAPYVAHFNGRRWRAVRPPAGPSAISAVSARSPDDIWAVLGRLPLVTSGRTLQRNALAHWNGHRWTSIPLPATLACRAFGSQAVPAATLTSIVALSDRNVWVGGGIPNGARGLTEMAAHWTGARWRVVMLPAYVTPVLYELTSMVPDGSGGAWAVATSAALTRSRLWHLHGGRWAGPLLLKPCLHACVMPGLAWVPGTTSVWAAGAAVHGSGATGLMAVTGRRPS